jgi:hypothetical protein
MRALLVAVAVLAACGSSLPAPPKTTQPPSAFVEVPAPPPPAEVERVPEHPRVRAVWIDGSWEWTGTAWRWKVGGWFAAPRRGIAYADWATARPGGTRLLFADATWRDHSGAEVPGPPLLAAATMPSANAGEDVSAGDAGAERADRTGDASP